MNKSTRDAIKGEIGILKKVADKIEDIKYREEEKLDSIPENLSSGSIYRQIEDAIENLTDAVDYVDSAIKSLEMANENN